MSDLREASEYERRIRTKIYDSNILTNGEWVYLVGVFQAANEHEECAALSAQPQPEAVEAVADLTPEQICIINDMIHAWVEDKATFRQAFRDDCKRLLKTVVPPLAPDTERMRMALERELTDCQSAVDTIEQHRDTANETQNGNYRFYQGSVASLKFALQALSGADGASNASAEARLRGVLDEWRAARQDIFANTTNISEENAARWTRLSNAENALMQALSAGGDEATKSEGGDTGNAEADRVIDRLMSSDPDFNDCLDAAILIRRLVVEHKGPDGFATWKDAAIAGRMKPGIVSDPTAAPAVDVEAIARAIRAHAATQASAILSLLNASDAERAR